jgi:fructokinase
MTKKALMVGLGEVLWDLLPARKALGGAPANFAYMASVLGDQGIVASRIGTDQLGHDACARMRELGLNTTFVQQDEQHGTGTARVSIDVTGQPDFTIQERVAWDFLEWTPAWEELAANADVICFGTLAQRSPVSASTIKRFLTKSQPSALRICDVNLRQSFYDREVLHRSFCHANVVKLTGPELSTVADSLELGIRSGEDWLARELLREYRLRLVCITRGPQGSLLVSDEETVEHRGFAVDVVDTVGAGDAFAACLAHHLHLGRSLEEMSRSANRLASWVATQPGAMPPVDHQHLSQIAGIGV